MVLFIHKFHWKNCSLSGIRTRWSRRPLDHGLSIFCFGSRFVLKFGQIFAEWKRPDVCQTQTNEFSLFQVCVTFVFSALLEYALVNYASRSDAQRLAKRKVQKQWEIDHCTFEQMEEVTQPPHQQANNGGGSFAMVNNLYYIIYKIHLCLMTLG